MGRRDTTEPALIAMQCTQNQTGAAIGFDKTGWADCSSVATTLDDFYTNDRYFLFTTKPWQPIILVKREPLPASNKTELVPYWQSAGNTGLKFFDSPRDTEQVLLLGSPNSNGNPLPPRRRELDAETATKESGALEKREASYPSFRQPISLVYSWEFINCDTAVRRDGVGKLLDRRC